MRILQARILEWVVIHSSRESSQPRGWTQVSHIAVRFFTSWTGRAYQQGSPHKPVESLLFFYCSICFLPCKPPFNSKSSFAAAAKSLQSCPTLCDPIDSNPPGSPVPGILQARTLEWAAISFSNEWKWKVKVKSFSRVQPSATPCSLPGFSVHGIFQARVLEWGAIAFSEILPQRIPYKTGAQQRDFFSVTLIYLYTYNFQSTGKMYYVFWYSIWGAFYLF